jgi:zinc transport system permease protein
MPTEWVDAIVWWIAKGVGAILPNTIYAYPHNVYGLLAILLIGLICGSVGSLVVGNRMAFFSDALAHCAFAGVGLGLLTGMVTGAGHEEMRVWITPIMVAFGIMFGLGIAFVRQQTGQANDTIIAVFFAGAIGLGAVFFKAASERRYVPAEDFLFGSLVMLGAHQIVELMLLAVGILVVLALIYNNVVLASFNTSLARSRGIGVDWLHYLFIVLLAVLVNICLQTVGVLLINAFLIVPAAAAANVCRNMRQLFPCAIALCIGSGVFGQVASWEIAERTRTFRPGESGTIVIVTVLVYFASVAYRSFWKERLPGWKRRSEKALPA